MDIFLLEDDDAIAMGLTYSLEPEGYEVTRASTVKEAMLLMAERTFSLYILDLTLPDGSGYDVCRKIKEKGDFPVIILTVMEEEVNVVMGLELGADDYITKPFDSEELLARLNAISRRKGEYVGNSLTFGDLTLNKNTRELSVENSKTLLSGKEYEIMEMLMLSNNTIIEKEKFFQKIWGYDSEAEYNTIEVYISFLRRKLEALNSNVKIKTIRSVGYKLEKNA